MASSSKSPQESQDVEKMMKNLKIQEIVEEEFQESVTEAGGSSFVGEGSDSKGKNKKPKSLVSLRSSEGDVFELEESCAMLSQTIKHMIEDDCAGNVISLANISTEILARVVVFLEKHGEIKERYEDEKQELIEWNKKFIEDANGDRKTLFDLIAAANFLAAECLMAVTCQAVADMMKGKTPEWIREFFGIKNDFTPEEEEEGRRENQQWAFKE
ncbi:hypothetical protein MKW94_014675 [Papaver nudicaule]|uniref:SKP1-like protein n=1 Tax=Papaver nudicaule TaxID=74823 RepID=A0AA42AYA9_PAPNU|nr:hypothetical protein [Papaver nudicaule]